MDRHLEELARQDRLFAIMPTIYANANRGKGKSAKKLDEFIIHDWTGKKKSKKLQTQDEMLLFARTIADVTQKELERSTEV